MGALLVGHFCAIAVGITLGLLGGGGAILAVPILVYIIGVGVKSAIAISLISIGMVSTIGSVLHWRKGNVRPGIALLFAPTAVIGAYWGASLAAVPWIDEDFQLLCFSFVMLSVSLLTIFKGRSNLRKTDSLYSEAVCPKRAYKSRRWLVPVEGLGVGLLTGFVGIGGGFVIVPTLVLLADIPMKQAVGTSLLIIALNSAAGFTGYLGQIDIHWPLVSSFTIAACTGTLLGSYLNQFISARILQAGFGYFVLSFSILMLIAQF